jgi:uncharacterized protein YggE
MDQPVSSPPNKVNFSVDLRVVVIILLLAIGCMLAAWKPWHGSAASDSARTISVTGEAKVSATPDEFVFSPRYQFKNTDKAAGLAELTKQSNDIIAHLRQLGVADSKIKTNTDGYDNYGFYYDESTGLNTYSLVLTITVMDKVLTQKIQDYLLTTTPSGPVSPQAIFSETKQKQLESKARDQATKDARAKAEQSAKNVGFTIGKVKSVKDGSGFNGPIAVSGATAATDLASGESKQSLPVQSGENDISYTVEVVYFVK